MDGHGDVVQAALDLNLRDAGRSQLHVDQLANAQVFLEKLGVVLVGVPLGRPRLRDAESEAYWVNLLSHGQASFALTTTVMWVIGL